MIAEIRVEGGKYNVYYRGECISSQNTMLKATEKLFKYIKGLG
jgi:hypothetical protein